MPPGLANHLKCLIATAYEARVDSTQPPSRPRPFPWLVPIDGSVDTFGWDPTPGPMIESSAPMVAGC